MLLGINPLLTPDLLMILRAMGHGDEITIVDANYPAAEQCQAAGTARRCGRHAGAGSDPVGDAARTPSSKVAANCMQVVGKPEEIPPAVADFQTVVDRLAALPRASRPHRALRLLRPRQAVFAIVATGERRLYGNIILTKGVIGADGKVVYDDA